MRVQIISAVFASLYPALTASAQDCSLLLQHGIYDITSSETSLETASSFAGWFCDQRFYESREAEKFGASIGFPFKGAPVKFGFDSESQNWEQWYTNFCASVRQDDTLKLKVRNHLQSVSSVLVDGYNECLNNYDGLHVWLERTFDPRRFRVAAKYRPPSSEGPQTATIDRMSPSPNVNCDQPLLDLEVGPQERRISCMRTDDNPIDITINQSSQPPRGAASLVLPAVWNPPPKPPSPPAEAACRCDGRGPALQWLDFWGPEGQACNGIPVWDPYEKDCTGPNPRICRCDGDGSVAGVSAWGPEGQPCWGMVDGSTGNTPWGSYDKDCVSLAKGDWCSCIVPPLPGAANIALPPIPINSALIISRQVLGGHQLWGPRFAVSNQYCGGVTTWGVYDKFCR